MDVVHAVLIGKAGLVTRFRNQDSALRLVLGDALATVMLVLWLASVVLIIVSPIPFLICAALMFAAHLGRTKDD